MPVSTFGRALLGCAQAPWRIGASQPPVYCFTLASSECLGLSHLPPHFQNPVKLPSVATTTCISFFLLYCRGKTLKPAGFYLIEGNVQHY